VIKQDRIGRRMLLANGSYHVLEAVASHRYGIVFKNGQAIEPAIQRFLPNRSVADEAPDLARPHRVFPATVRYLEPVQYAAINTGQSLEVGDVSPRFSEAFHPIFRAIQIDNDSFFHLVLRSLT
jgi:hypothetical protein